MTAQDDADDRANRGGELRSASGRTIAVVEALRHVAEALDP